MADAQRELHQRSLRNVRALLEQEQAEFERQKRSTRLVVWVALPVALLVAGLVLYASRTQPPRELAQKQRMDCETEAWAAKSGEAERAIRQANPGMSPSEVGRKLQAENPSFQAAAREECRKRLGP